MRIKSYFAASVQSAIALARAEFGDDVTLVTSHVSSLDNRHLGEYEVVFAVEAPAEPAADEPEPLAPLSFENLLQQAITTKPSPQENLPEKLKQLRLLLIEMGIESAMVRALMTMVERCVPAAESLVAPMIEQAESEPAEAEASPAQAIATTTHYTPAELAFVLSVSEPVKHASSLTPKWALGV